MGIGLTQFDSLCPAEQNGVLSRAEHSDARETRDIPGSASAVERSLPLRSLAVRFLHAACGLGRNDKSFNCASIAELRRYPHRIIYLNFTKFHMHPSLWMPCKYFMRPIRIETAFAHSVLHLFPDQRPAQCGSPFLQEICAADRCICPGAISLLRSSFGASSIIRHSVSVRYRYLFAARISFSLLCVHYEHSDHDPVKVEFVQNLPEAHLL